MPSKKYYYWVVTSTRIYDIVTYFTYEIKSCQNQNLCFKSFDYHSDRGYRKYLQSLLASSMTNWGNLVQISWCWVTFKYSFLSMKQVRIILHTLLITAIKWYLSYTYSFDVFGSMEVALVFMGASRSITLSSV